jgi:serine protease Do
MESGYHIPEKKPKRNPPFVMLLLLSVAVSGAAGFAGGMVSSRMADTSAPLLNLTAAGYQVTYSDGIRNVAANDPTKATALTEMVARVRDSVVEISTTYPSSSSYNYSGQEQRGAGSGVILSNDGYIVTNDHVITGANSITITLTNGKKYPATLIGTDPQTDIAVLKISATGLKPAIFGDPAKVTLGEMAIAIGNPLGELGGSVTSGIVSALDRAIAVEGVSMTLMQTDAAINIGNSGGALFNISGELIGIVNAKHMGSSIDGLGFAIPLNIAKASIDSIMAYGYVKGRGEIGISVQEISSTQMAIWYNVSETGLYISASENPALKANDRVISVNGTKINDFASFKSIVSKFGAGDTIQVTVERDGQTVTVDVTLRERKN